MSVPSGDLQSSLWLIQLGPGPFSTAVANTSLEKPAARS
jgi:hypothetical protein